MRKLLAMLLTLCLLATLLPAALAEAGESEPAIVGEAEDAVSEASVGEDVRPLFEAEPSLPRADEGDFQGVAEIDFSDPEAVDAAEDACAPNDAERSLALEQGLELEYQPTEGECDLRGEGGEDNDERFGSFLDNIFYGDGESARRTMATSCVGSTLTGLTRTIYEAVKTEIILVAEGSRSSTEFQIPIVDLFGRTTFTAADLGVSVYGTPTDSDAERLSQAFVDLCDFDGSLVSSALRTDCNYELYWSSGQYRWRTPSYSIRYTGSDLVLSVASDACIVFALAVDGAYAAGDQYAFNTSLVATARDAARRARAIVGKYAACTDYVKLFGYAVEICALTDYNDAAVEPDFDRLNQHNPWKLIWVFDGDESTQVVCEGYARAFQYLCELSQFEYGIQCYLVSGEAGGSHAWNIVRMDDGQRYLVDVTWMDGELDYHRRQGHSLADMINNDVGRLFLCGAGSGDASGSFRVDYRGQSGDVSWRSYYPQVLKMYSLSTLTLAPEKYVVHGFQRIGENTYFFNDKGNYLTGGWYIGGVAYNFDDSGRMQDELSGWVEMQGGRLFFEPGGVLHTVHTPVTDDAVVPTCTESGLTEGSHCAVCGTVLVPQTIAPARGHTPVVDPAVDPTGTKTGLTEGSHCGVCGEVLVAQKVVPKLEVTKLTLNRTGTVTLVLGKKLTLKATRTPSDAQTTLTWKSGNPKVATVSGKGVVKAVGKGAALITVKSANGVTAKVKIKVVAPAPTRVKLTQGRKKTLKAGEKLALTAKLSPKNAESKLKWTSDDKKVAAVSKKGIVVARKPGTAKITVTTANGKTASIVIVVSK